MKIEIVKNDAYNSWSISVGDQLSDELCFDEALGVVASLLLGVKPRYMQTMEQWFHAKYNRCEIIGDAFRLTDQRVIAGHVIQAEYQRAPIREVMRSESARIKNKTFPNL